MELTDDVEVLKLSVVLLAMCVLLSIALIVFLMLSNRSLRAKCNHSVVGNGLDSDDPGAVRH